jgi:4-hydroxythreonine-4-phosphate dehydrogenase
MTVSFSRPLALSQGDPAGIGPDVTLMAWLRRRELGLPPFLFIGDPGVLATRARMLDLTVAIRESDCTGAADIFADALPVLPISAGIEVVAGEAHVATAKGTIAAIEKAVSLTVSGEALGVVTNPIAKVGSCTRAASCFPATPSFWQNWQRGQPDSRSRRS